MPDWALKVSFDLVFHDTLLAGRRPWRIWDLANTLEEAEDHVRGTYGHAHNPPLKFRRVRAEKSDGAKVAGAGPWER